MHVTVAQAASAVTVSPIAPNAWGFGQEVATGTGSFVAGPATAPLGAGSARMTLDATGREVLGTLAYSGTLLSQLTTLEYSTYRSSADPGDNLAISLQLDIDYDMTDANKAWQGRLVPVLKWVALTLASAVSPKYSRPILQHEMTPMPFAPAIFIGTAFSVYLETINGYFSF